MILNRNNLIIAELCKKPSQTTDTKKYESYLYIDKERTMVITGQCLITVSLPNIKTQDTKTTKSLYVPDKPIYLARDRALACAKLRKDETGVLLEKKQTDNTAVINHNGATYACTHKDFSIPNITDFIFFTEVDIELTRKQGASKTVLFSPVLLCKILTVFKKFANCETISITHRKDPNGPLKITACLDSNYVECYAMPQRTPTQKEDEENRAYAATADALSEKAEKIPHLADPDKLLLLQAASIIKSLI